MEMPGRDTFHAIEKINIGLLLQKRKIVSTLVRESEKIGQWLPHHRPDHSNQKTSILAEMTKKLAGLALHVRRLEPVASGPKLLTSNEFESFIVLVGFKW